MDRLSTDQLAQYLEEISRYDLLTAEEEVGLAQAIEAGEEARRRLDDDALLPAGERAELEAKVVAGGRARERFIQANLRLVVANARRYGGDGIPLLDLIQEGNLGLMTAVERFDWRKGFKFSTYATWWIRQAMQRARANLTDAIRVPTGVFDLLPTVRSAEDTLKLRLGRRPTAEEIAEETGIEVGDVDKALSVATTVALETPVGEDGASLGDFIADDEAPDPSLEVEARMVAEALRHNLDRLPELNRQIVALRFGLGDTAPASIVSIARMLETPEHRVREIISESIGFLSKALADVEGMRAA